jgi:hypothetical protein
MGIMLAVCGGEGMLLFVVNLLMKNYILHSIKLSFLEISSIMHQLCSTVHHRKLINNKTANFYGGRQSKIPEAAK